MDAREYLSQLKTLKTKIRHKQEHLKKIDMLSIGGGANDGERVQTSKSLSAPYENMAIQIADLRRDIARLETNYHILWEEIENTIYEIEKTKQLKKVREKWLYIEVMRRKWVTGNSLEEISVDVYKSFDYVRHIYWNGMKAVQEVLDERDK